MADITEREIFQGIVVEKFKRGIIGIDPDDVQAVFDEIGEDFLFFSSNFESVEDLKNVLAGIFPQHSGKTRSACFAIDASPDATLEYIDSIAMIISDCFDGDIVWSVGFDDDFVRNTFCITLLCSRR